MFLRTSFFRKFLLYLEEKWPEMDVKWPSLCFVLFVSNKSLVGYKVKMMDSDFEHFLKVEQKIKIPSEI